MVVLVDLAIGTLIITVAFLIYKAALKLGEKEKDQK